MAPESHSTAPCSGFFKATWLLLLPLPALSNIVCAYLHLTFCPSSLCRIQGGLAMSTTCAGLASAMHWIGVISFS
jgi:hypothetical protein